MLISGTPPSGFQPLFSRLTLTHSLFNLAYIPGKHQTQDYENAQFRSCLDRILKLNSSFSFL